MNQNNISLERVIKGLECHARAMYGEIDEYGFACNQCPYKDMESTCHSRTEGDLISDALELLKAQEPRVLTLAELEHAEVAYAEDIDKDEIIPILVNGRQHDRFNMVRARLGNNPSRVFYPSIFDYNKRWRCWTLKPTNKQRQETKWV